MICGGVEGQNKRAHDPTHASLHPPHVHAPIEAIALIATVLTEMIRDGDKTVAALMDLGRKLLGHRQVGFSMQYIYHVYIYRH